MSASNYIKVIVEDNGFIVVQKYGQTFDTVMADVERKARAYQANCNNVSLKVHISERPPLRTGMRAYFRSLPEMKKYVYKETKVIGPIEKANEKAS